MINKNLIFLIFFIFLSHCGYSAVYNENLNLNVKITLLNMSGDREFNNKIDSKLRKFYNKETQMILLFQQENSIPLKILFIK